MRRLRGENVSGKLCILMVLTGGGNCDGHGASLGFQASRDTRCFVYKHVAHVGGEGAHRGVETSLFANKLGDCRILRESDEAIRSFSL